MKKGQPIKIGLMGVGVVAGYGHIPAIQRNKNLQLYSIFEPDAGRLIEAKAKYNVAHGFNDLNLFFKSGIDAVVITSPAPTHYQNVMLASSYKKPVLCEKPLAMNDAESERMIEAMKTAGVPLFVGFTYRFAPNAREIHKLIKDGAIGQPRSLRLIYLWDCHGASNPRDNPNSPNLHRKGRMDEGGPMVDCGVHQIDLARWWLGSEVKRHQGVGVWVDGHDAPDHVYLHMDHENGAHTMVEMSYSYAHTSKETRCEFVYELIGTDGLIRYDRQARVFELVNKHGTQHKEWVYEKNFDGMYEEFDRALRTGKPGDMPTGEDGLIATRLAQSATQEAMKSRKPG